ncbi:MAG TPA: TadE family protein [Polyangia bacterium]|jgi:hypothetical protein
MRTLRTWSSRLRGEEGQSLTEFAIIAPVLVGILIFAIFFYEATQIKLKQQEAERYVTWEFTGKQLTDYGQGGNQSGLFNSAKTDILVEGALRFANLVSTDHKLNQSHYVMTEWQLRLPTIHYQTVPDVPGGFWVNLVFNIFKIVFMIWDAQTFISPNLIHQGMMWGSETQPTFAGSGAIGSQFGADKHWKFNTKGYLQVKMKWKIRPTAFMPKNLMDSRFDNKRFRDWSSITLDDKASPDGLALIVDHWNLQDGRAINGGKGNDHGSAYWKQLDRMAFVSPASKGVANVAAKAGQVMLSLVSMLCLQPPLTLDPMETALTSKPYGNSPGTRNVQTDRGNVAFDTSPYTGAYKNAYQQRGNNFMGCPQPEILGCNRSLSSNNPFGEFIVTGANP